MRILKLAAAAMLGVAAVGLAGCATGFPAKVSRYQAMPAPAGQSFYIMPFEGPDAAGLEFAHYASMVSEALRAHGYEQSPSPAAATMLVRLGYGVDNGRTVIESDPFPRHIGYGFGGFYGRPYYSRFGGRYGYGRSPFYYGWGDPFYYSRLGGGIDSYIVYVSHLDLDIRRRVDNAPLFEGHAKAQSQTDELNRLVPNLVEAMFTGFPGRSGETIKITVPPPAKRAS
jgi:hypothetical protein